MEEETCHTCEGLRASLFAVWAWLVFALLAPLAWLLSVVAPSATASWRILKTASRLALWSTATAVTVRGAQHLTEGRGTSMLISNHASYLDVLVLMAVLPYPVSFVAKAELGRSWLTRLPLARIGTLFVERFDPHRSLDDYRRIATFARRGRSLLFFAEGTFREEPGLRPFQMGAFFAAVAAGLQVVPIALKGTRDILPARTLRPRRGAIVVTIAPPLVPASGERRRSAAVALKAATRQAILATIGEPDLDPPQPTAPA
jgi:1-acyl-sn-glycerol-3-phosphate acyltransferase